MPPPKGLTVWFTGLPCSGKTTLSDALKDRLAQAGHRVEQLDGDRVRQGLCRDLGFSKKDRHTNVVRVSAVASLLTREGIVTLVSLISPYRRMREHARRVIHPFIEIYVRCPLEVCAQRDVKGQYRLARVGKLKHFTGISDPYEEPEKPEIIVDTDQMAADNCVEKITDYLESRKLLHERTESSARRPALSFSLK